MDILYPRTFIVRHPRENPRKCSILPLRGRPDLTFLTHPLVEPISLDGYVRLAAEGPASPWTTPRLVYCCSTEAGAGPK